MSDAEVIADAMAVSGLKCGLLPWLLGCHGVLVAISPADTALRLEVMNHQEVIADTMAVRHNACRCSTYVQLQLAALSMRVANLAHQKLNHARYCGMEHC